MVGKILKVMGVLTTGITNGALRMVTTGPIGVTSTAPFHFLPPPASTPCQHAALAEAVPRVPSANMGSSVATFHLHGSTPKGMDAATTSNDAGARRLAATEQTGVI